MADCWDYRILRWPPIGRLQRRTRCASLSCVALLCEHVGRFIHSSQYSTGLSKYGASYGELLTVQEQWSGPWSKSACAWACIPTNRICFGRFLSVNLSLGERVSQHRTLHKLSFGSFKVLLAPFWRAISHSSCSKCCGGHRKSVRHARTTRHSCPAAGQGETIT